MALGAIAVTYAGLLLGVLPVLEERKVVPDLARWVAGHASPAHRVAMYRMNRWSPAFRFYVDRHTLSVETPDEAARLFDEPGPFYCAMAELGYKELVAHGVPLEVVYSRDGMWATSGQALWRDRNSLTRFLIVTRATGKPPPHDADAPRREL